MRIHPTVGRRYTATDHYEVGREKIRDFARAVQDFHPAHWADTVARDLGHPGLLAPITFPSAVTFPAHRKLMRAALDGYDPAHLLHVEQEIHSNRPVTAGDRLTHDITVDSRRSTPAGGELIALTTTIHDDTGAVVQTVHTTLAGRDHGSSPTAEALAMLDLPGPETIRTPPSPEAADVRSGGNVRRTAVPDLRQGQEFPARTVRLTRGELVHYAGVSGDINPIHWHDAAARHAGLDAVAAHGMLTMGLGAACLSEWLGTADRVVAYYVQFARPVVLEAHRPADVTFRAVVRSIDPVAMRATISLTAHYSDTPAFGAASATVELV
ncbi:fused (3R)-hydroxyacyl-ACP dehydratase subunits HadA/HadB [Nocardia sp. NBC_00881]|uniref:fused (3R)-hydroxyacyl-ACP dehydratase subunits HadA/HadB n=1 Tax=Nocardia sp. NBC_00881 TaxID=2975995 RepID=UPI003870AA92|nr:fused (3R)-hydroxyacyl-ACP dehydratase subunits HadA/HadB [Nocardia sp. NBC_00881]